LYNSADIAENIKNIAKQKKVTLKNMLSECGLNSNTISQLHHNQMIGADRLAKIADYLDVSVDYLLNRKNYDELFNEADYKSVKKYLPKIIATTKIWFVNYFKEDFYVWLENLDETTQIELLHKLYEYIIIEEEKDTVSLFPRLPQDYTPPIERENPESEVLKNFIKFSTEQDESATAVEKIILPLEQNTKKEENDIIQVSKKDLQNMIDESVDKAVQAKNKESGIGS